MRRASRWWVVLCAATLSCATSSNDDDDVSDVVLTVTVTDSTGNPVRAVPIVIESVRDTHSVTLAYAITTDSLGVVQVTDTLGRVGQAPDSIRVTIPAMNGECNTFVAQERTVRRRRGVGDIQVGFEANLSAPLATASSGEYCGLGFGLFDVNLGSLFSVKLQIDSITDSIRGVFTIDFLATIASVEGTLRGVPRSDSLVIDLVPGVFPPCTPLFRLSGALTAGQGTRLVRLEDQNSCGWSYPSSETPFWMIVYDNPLFPVTPEPRRFHGRSFDVRVEQLNMTAIIRRNQDAPA